MCWRCSRGLPTKQSPERSRSRFTPSNSISHACSTSWTQKEGQKRWRRRRGLRPMQLSGYCASTSSTPLSHDWRSRSCSARRKAWSSEPATDDGSRRVADEHQVLRRRSPDAEELAVSPAEQRRAREIDDDAATRVIAFRHLGPESLDREFAPAFEPAYLSHAREARPLRRASVQTAVLRKPAARPSGSAPQPDRLRRLRSARRPRRLSDRTRWILLEEIPLRSIDAQREAPRRAPAKPRSDP